MDAANIELLELSGSGLRQMEAWYDQPNKSWIYCDCPSDKLDFSHVRQSIEAQLKTKFEDLDNRAAKRHKYYSIVEYLPNYAERRVGFAVVSKRFVYFNEYDLQRYVIGLAVPERHNRGRGYEAIALRKLLRILKDAGIREVCLETLSYYETMRDVAEKNGFELIERREAGEDCRRGFANHIDEIADCLDASAQELKKTKIEALLYRINLDNWPCIALKRITEANTGLFTHIEICDDSWCPDPYELEDHESTENEFTLAFYNHDTVIGGATLAFDTDKHSCYIGDYFIDQNYHSCGYGTKTLNAMIEYIKTNQTFKADKIVLDVDTRNMVAINLYWKTGFRPYNYDSYHHCWEMELNL